MPLDSKRTIENLAGLNKKARAKFVEFLTAANPVFVRHGVMFEVISGLRSYAQQAALYAQGRTKPGPIVTKAPAGSSWHNYGLAMDLGLFQNGVYLDEKKPALAEKIYSELADVARPMGIEWAGDWTSFTETPHFQYRPGIASIAEAKRRLLAAGQDVQQML
jgi:peptidoglycan L-alanyl-D-glutamate endopeptidase CwlK